MVVLDLITDALTSLVIFGPGESPAPEDSALAFRRLNNMIDGWNTDPWMGVRRPVFTFVLTNLVGGPYLIGPGGQFAAPNNVRPILITAATIQPAGSTLQLTLDILTPKEWADIREKTSSGVAPERLFCDYAFPIANVFVQPAPVGAATLFLWMISQLNPFVTIQDVLALPPEYTEAMQFDLAVTLASDFGKPVPQAVMQKAIDSKTRIRQANARAFQMALDQGQTQVPQQQPPPPQQ